MGLAWTGGGGGLLWVSIGTHTESVGRELYLAPVVEETRAQKRQGVVREAMGSGIRTASGQSVDAYLSLIKQVDTQQYREGFGRPQNSGATSFISRPAVEAGGEDAAFSLHAGNPLAGCVWAFV